MKFALEVGNEMESFKLECESSLLGDTVIKINDREVKRSKNLLVGPMRETHDFNLGNTQPLSLRIEKQRKLFFRQINRIFVDGRLVRCFEGR